MPHCRRAFARCAVLGAALSVVAIEAAAQDAASDAAAGQVCPLSEDQTQMAIDAFAKIVPVFHEPRCIRCHGELNPFADPTPHGGGTQGDATGCDACHDHVVGGGSWTLPEREHFFVGKDAKTLCEQIHDSLPNREVLLKHMNEDKLIRTAFLGTRGLSKKDLEKEHLTADPPRMTQEELLSRTLGWVDAMDGELMGEKQCGCEPLHYAIRMTYTKEANIGIAGATEQMGPVDIPIKFHDDRSFDGEQTVYLDGDSFAYLCTAKTSASMDLKVSGKISGFYPHEMMTVKLENTAPLEGKVKANCPEVHRTARLQAGGTAALGDTIEATVGKTLEFKPSSGLIMTKIELELVTTGK